MTAARTPAGGNGTYTYADRNQNELVSQTVPGGATIKYTYGRTDRNGLPQIEQVGLNGLYAYLEHDPTTGQPLAIRVTDGNEAFYINDGLSRPVALVNAAGTTSTYAYDPYGVTTTTAGGSAAGQNPYRFAPGSIYDRTTSMLKYGQRWYSPTTGRFTQQDSIDHLANPRQGNKYAYAGDDPINNIDPSGQGFFDVLNGVVQVFNDAVDASQNYIISCNDTGISAAIAGAVAGAILGEGVGAAPGAAAAYVGGCASGIFDLAVAP